MPSDREFMEQLRRRIEAAPVAEVRLADVKRSAKRRRALQRAVAPSAVAVAAVVGLLVGWPAGPGGGALEVAIPGESAPTDADCATSDECSAASDADGWSLEAQARLAPFAATVHAAADDEPGFGGITFNYRPEGLLLRWAGEVPEGVTRAVDSVRSEGVEVTVVPVTYGAEMLLRLSVQVADALLSEGIEFASVGASPDGSAIEVHGVAGPSPSVCSDDAARARVMEIAEAIARDVPVRCGPDELPSVEL